MRVYLMRHGIAIDRADPECPPEAERFLTPKGVERTRKAAQGLGELGVKPAILLTSPYVRAVQTGEVVCEVLDLDARQLQATDALKPDAKPSRLYEELKQFVGKEVICFGHAPHMDTFIAHITQAGGNFTALRKAGVACLDFDVFSQPHAILLWLLTAKLLRRLGN